MKKEMFYLTFDPETKEVYESTEIEHKLAVKISGKKIVLGYGGMIVLSTDVNAVGGSKIRNFLRTWYQRWFKRRIVDKKILELMKEKGVTTGFGIGNLFDGRYYDEDNKKMFNEKSFAIDMRGADIELVEFIGTELAKQLKQKAVLIINHKTNESYILEI